MNPYCMEIGTEDDDEKYVEAPERTTTPTPVEIPAPSTTPSPVKVPAGV